jgi:NADH-quinone oxidoreductase subunit E
MGSSGVLSDDERRELEELLTHYGQRSSGVLTVLKFLQKRRGSIDDAAMQDAAALVGLTPHEAESIASFYNLLYRKPVGRHVILLCDSFACYLTGYDDVRAHLEDSLGIQMGQTTADGRFTLLPIVCLGACHLAPAMLVDEDLHGPLTAAEIDRVLARYA